MRNGDVRPLGAALLAVGALVLLMRVGVFGLLPAVVWVIGLFVAGAVFWRRTEGRMPRWQRIVGYAAIGLLAVATSDPLGGVAFMGFVAMAFWTTYLNRYATWTLLVAGLFTALTGVVAVEELLRWDGGTLFVLGAAATFSAIYLLPRDRGGASWALVPAILFAILTVAVNDPQDGAPAFLLPVLLIAGGVGLLLWWRRRQ